MKRDRKRNAGNGQWRAFCAVEIPGDVSLNISRHIDHLRSAFPNAKVSWNRDGKFHLTLKFIGEIPESRVEDLSQAAERATIGIAPFDLIIEGTGAFPLQEQPRVLWLGINDFTGNLRVLQKRLDDECAREGFVKEERTFRPHLTVGRVRHPQGARELATAHKNKGFSPLEMSVGELLVIRSESGGEGSKYSVISTHSLEPQE